MKQMLLFGLTALALVFLPSYSNILEGSGDPPITTETGKLNPALEADASVSMTTKATSTVTVSDEVKSNLVITGTKGGSPIILGKSSDFVDGATRTVPAGIYVELSATYSQIVGDLQFDDPMLAGKTTGIVTVTPNAAAVRASVTATLTDSIIMIDPGTFAELQRMATTTKLYVYTGTAADPTKENPEYSPLSAVNTLETGKTLLVKPGLSNMYIRIEGELITDETKTFAASSPIKEKDGTTTTVEKSYNVRYSLSNTQGTLTLSINVNGTIKAVEIPVGVNPYEWLSPFIQIFRPVFKCNDITYPTFCSNFAKNIT